MLSHAAEMGWSGLEFVKKLLSLGADPTIADQAGRTPLMYAVQNNDRSEYLCCLIPPGSTDLVNAPDNEGKTPLMYATDVEWRPPDYRFDHVFHLITEAADPSATMPDGRTALWYAVKQNQQLHIESLLRRHVSTDCLGPQSFNCLIDAAQNGKTPTVAAMVAFKDQLLAGANDTRVAAYHMATAHGHWKVVETLIMGVRFNVGYWASSTAVWKLDFPLLLPDSVLSLPGLSHTVKLNMVITLVRFAAYHGDNTFLQKLLATHLLEAPNTDVDGPSEVLCSILQNGSKATKAIVQAVISSGYGALSIPSANHSVGYPPLSVAAAAGNLEYVQCLVDNGANVLALCSFRRNHEDDGNSTAAMQAAAGCHVDVLRLLVTHMGLEHINGVDEGGRNVAVYACRYKIDDASRLATLRFLVDECGVSPSSVCAQGMSLLHRTVEHGSDKSSSFLVSRGSSTFTLYCGLPLCYVLQKGRSEELALEILQAMVEEWERISNSEDAKKALPTRVAKIIAGLSGPFVNEPRFCENASQGHTLTLLELATTAGMHSVARKLVELGTMKQPNSTNQH